MRFHWTKKVFSLVRKSLSINRNAFKNMFPPEGKIKLVVAGVPKMEENNGFR